MTKFVIFIFFPPLLLLLPHDPSSKILYIEGRQHPVEIYYSKENYTDYVDAAITTTLQIHIENMTEPGDVLVFLTGQEEIEQACQILEDKARKLPPEAMKILVCPIFSALPYEKQMEVFAPTPSGCRKVIVATNIAETSITVSGVKFVVDTGKIKQKNYLPNIKMDFFQVTDVSKASADQRAGRAGRESRGTCYRLYTFEKYQVFHQYTTPEILRCELSSVVLKLKSLGIQDLMKFEFISRPSLETRLYFFSSQLARFKKNNNNLISTKFC